MAAVAFTSDVSGNLSPLERDISGYDPNPPARRKAVLFGIVTAHAIILFLMLWQQRPPQDQPALAPLGQGLAVFDVGEEATSSAVRPPIPIDPPISTLAPSRNRAVEPPALPAMQAAGTGSGNPIGEPQNVGDPFAAAALTIGPAEAVLSPGTVPIRSTLIGLDQARLASLLLAFSAGAARAGSVLLRCDVGEDGRIIHAAFLGGSLAPELGAALAKTIESQRLFPSERGKRLALLGPVMLPLVREAGV